MKRSVTIRLQRLPPEWLMENFNLDISMNDSAFLKDHPRAIDGKVRYLYRYQPILSASATATTELRDTTISRLRKLLVDQWLYHGLPKQMNDPFEARPHFQWPSNAEELRKQRNQLLRISKKQDLLLSPRQQRAKVNEIMSNPERYSYGFRKGIEDSFGRQRFCCFTELSNDLLFWAHYADSHRGMCLEFDATFGPISRAHQVRYEEEYPTMTVYSGWKDDPLRMLLTKSLDWSREREYRSLLLWKRTEQFETVDPTGSFIQIPSRALTGVYFGAETSEEDKKVVLDLISEGPFNPSIYHGELSPNSYKVVFSQH